MYPAQTSLIPVQIALARFLETHGLAATLGNYPYWYLGTTPYRYLTGPILPSVLVLLHRLLPGLNLFEIFFGLIGLIFPFGALGIYLLVKELRGGRFSAPLAAFFYFFGLIVPFLFRFSGGLYLITFSFLPYVLVLYAKFLKNGKHGATDKKQRIEILLCLSIAFLILLDSLIIPTLVLGMAAIFLAQVGWKKTEEKLKRTLLVVSCSFLVATAWYSPGYWLTLLGAPSLAGKGLISVVDWLLKLLPTALAFGMAIVSVKFFKKKNLLRDFVFYWLFVFGFLSLLRFLSDPDFWMDWIAYGLELQLGLSILGALIIERVVGHANTMRMKILRMNANVLISFVVCCLLFVVWLSLTNRYVLATFQRDITGTVEYKIGRQLSQTAKPEEIAFLSGTSAFWLNAFFDIPQVRGGKDQAAVHPDWRKAVWEIMEGVDAKSAKEWLKTLKIKYLVVHTKESKEFYHDFKYPEKFEEASGLEKVYDKAGDRIYRLED